MLQQITPTQAKAAERHRSFHASISERAARVGVIPLAPFVPKAQAINPTPYWMHMWFFDLVTFGESYVPGKTISRPRDAKGIQMVVANYYGVKLSDILSSRRTKEVIKPRHVAMYLLKELTEKSLPEIGRRFARRDHTTVLSAVRKIDRLLKTDQGLQNDVKHLMARLA